MNTDLRKRRILVTGGAGGIGQEICRALAREGAIPLIHYRTSAESAEALRLQIRQNSGVDAETYQADLSDEASVVRLFKELKSAGGVTDLVANAGIYPSAPVPLREMSLEQWNQTISTNLTGTFLCCREFLSQVAANKLADPAIVLISSTAAIFGEEGFADYSTSKAGLTGLCLTLKNEMVRVSARGRINTVCPGWVVTPMAESALAIPGALERVTATMALRKVASPEDIAASTLFLLSGKLAGHQSGTFLTVAGGMEGRLINTP